MPTLSQISTLRNEPFKGCYNVHRGLRRFRNALGRCHIPISGAGYGGLDIVALGTSILRGYGLGSPTYDSPIHQLKVRLQSRYNPAGVLGGFGLVRADADPGFTQGATPFTVGSGAAMIGDGRGSNTAMQMRFWFDGAATDAAAKRLGITAFEPIYVPTAAAQSFAWDLHGSNAFVTTGSGSVAHNTIVSTGTQSWATHHGSIPVDVTSGAAPTLSATNSYSLQFSPASGSIWLNGVIAYNGDIDCGVRVHNLAVNGSQLGSSFWNDTSAKQVVTNFCTASFGATHTKLIVSDFIANEAINDPSLANLATFKSTLASAVAAVTSHASLPCWLHVIPTCPSTVAVDTYRAYAGAIKDVCDANRDVMAVLDMAEIVDYGVYATWNAQLGWIQGDGIHPTGAGATALAQHLDQLLQLA